MLQNNLNNTTLNPAYSNSHHTTYTSMTTPNPSKYAIHEAAREGQAHIVSSLLAANPRLANLRDDDDRLPLHWGVSRNRVAVVELLMQRKDFDVDVKDGSGWTPLMIAVSLKESEELVGMLLGKGADVGAKSELCFSFR